MRRLAFSSFLWSFVLLSVMTVFSNATLFAVEEGIFEYTKYDFKGIPRYTKPRHSFIFQNQSDEVLRLVAARTSCQCTQVYIPDKREYKKGEKGEVVAEIDAVRYTGARHATLTLTFERSGRAFEIPLNVVGMVVDNVKLTPNHLNFIVDEQKPGAAAIESSSTSLQIAARSQIVTVQYRSNETAVKATSSSPYVEVELGKSIMGQGGSSVPLTVSISEDAPAGYIDATVSIWSNGASREHPLTLDVSGVVRASMMVSPPTLTFFTSPDGKKITKNIVVSASSPFTLKEVVSDSDSINVNISTKSIRPSKVCVVPVSFDPSKLRDESSSARLQIKTTDGRLLNLNAQISSGNFEANGLVQMDEPLPEIDETFAEGDQTIRSTDGEVSPNSAAPKGNVKIVDSVALPRSASDSDLQTSKRNVNTRYSSNGLRINVSNQTTPKTSRSSSNRVY